MNLELWRFVLTLHEQYNFANRFTIQQVVRYEKNTFNNNNHNNNIEFYFAPV